MRALGRLSGLIAAFIVAQMAQGIDVIFDPPSRRKPVRPAKEYVPGPGEAVSRQVRRRMEREAAKRNRS